MQFPIGRVARTNLSIAIDNGIICGMTTTIRLGKAGRFVVPKFIRDGLGLREGSRLRIDVSGGKFEATPEPDEVRIEMQGGFPVIRGGPARKKGDIVRAIQAGREERDERIVASRRRK
jgi:AbrB family looped-hinge helix DNA binding protein